MRDIYKNDRKNDCDTCRNTHTESFTVIKSFDNKYVAFIKKLYDKKSREQNGCFFAEGINAVKEALDSTFHIRYIVMSESFFLSPEAKTYIGKEYIVIADSVFNKLCETMTPQGICAVIDMKAKSSMAYLLKTGKRVLILDNVRDPGNMGTVIRTADAAGYDLIIASEGCVDIYNSKVIRSTAGSIFHIPVIEAHKAICEIGSTVKKADYSIYSAHPRGGNNCFDAVFSDKSAIIIGNEASGLSKEALELCDYTLTIPMFGKAESLNASVAAALMIYESIRKK